MKVVRHRKGHVNRAVLLRGKDEAHATNVRDYVGQAYSFPHTGALPLMPQVTLAGVSLPERRVA